MSANDNAMTRFLFAILQQKCLKDIDWNKVAHDPILAQEITNGHAARMRYSRFRAAMLGLEPQRRNRTKDNKSRVTKSKKETTHKKEEGCIKPDPASQAADTQDNSKTEPSPKVKQEQTLIAQAPFQPPTDQPTMSESPAAFSPNPLPTSGGLHSHYHARLLTPCSDSDVLARSQGYTASPSSEILHADPSFDFVGPSQCSHEQLSWQHAQAFPTFPVQYDFDNYATGFCGHQQDHHAADELAIVGGLLEGNTNHVVVKHEEWDAQRYQ